MGAARRTGPGRALAALPAVAVLACAALTGCGSTAAARDAPAGMTVCAHAGDVDRLTIRRVNSFPRNHVYFSFPAQVTVTSAPRAQAVAQALCALTAMPAGTFSCAMDWGISYRLIFTAGARKLPPVTVDATGCEQVTGLFSLAITKRPQRGSMPAMLPGSRFRIIVCHYTPYKGCNDTQ